MKDLMIWCKTFALGSADWINSCLMQVQGMSHKNPFGASLGAWDCHLWQARRDARPGQVQVFKRGLQWKNGHTLRTNFGFQIKMSILGSPKISGKPQGKPQAHEYRPFMVFSYALDMAVLGFEAKPLQRSMVSRCFTTQQPLMGELVASSCFFLTVTGSTVTGSDRFYLLKTDQDLENLFCISRKFSIWLRKRSLRSMKWTTG